MGDSNDGGEAVLTLLSLRRDENSRGKKKETVTTPQGTSTPRQLTGDSLLTGDLLLTQEQHLTGSQVVSAMKDHHVIILNPGKGKKNLHQNVNKGFLDFLVLNHPAGCLHQKFVIPHNRSSQAPHQLDPERGSPFHPTGLLIASACKSIGK
jgi:hypothetical protein